MSVLKYREQIYAGVLGKIIGVYLGRPVEGWSYDKIRETFDEVKYYVHEKVGVPLIVADDDISGTQWCGLKFLKHHTAECVVSHH